MLSLKQEKERSWGNTKRQWKKKGDETSGRESRNEKWSEDES